MNPFSTLLQLTDTHLGETEDFRLWGLAADELLRRVLADAHARFPRPDLVVHTGDATHDAGSPAQRQIEGVLAGWGAPVLWTPGNHDLPEVMAGQPVSFDLPGWRVLLVNSRKIGAVEGCIDDATLAWLDRELGAADAPVLLGLHHPPLPTGTPWLDRIGLENADALWRVIRRHARVRAIIHGHAHMEQTTLHEGVLVLGTPSTNGQFRPLSVGFALDGQPPGYRWLRLYRDGRLESGVVRVGG
ncbi:MAG: phosphodiesterase [Halothiobacillaceae bacterium]|jgi:Icc protein